jgi:hypothetical protein
MGHWRIIRALGIAAGLSVAAVQAQPLQIAAGGKSEYVIYHDAAAPGSVRVAALELQRVLQAATGAQLAVSAAPAEKMICLGANDAAAQAGVTAEGLAGDAFRIVTKGAALYIAGKDSPRNKLGWGGNEERGTLFGTYAFLERFANVRWLTPGEDGEDIPRTETLSVPPTDRTETPSFASRIIGGPQGYRDWNSRHGCGGWRVNHGHNWDSFPSRAVLKAHPEYLALSGKRRMAVPADDKAPFQPKFCTTNPGLVQAYAEGAVEWLERNPTQRFVSISPSDGGGWCECAECRKFMIKAPDPQWGDFGCYGRSVTPLILKFYNDVAKIVAQKCPDRIVCGYVYYDFTFPPDPTPKMEPNVALMLAPLQQYGLTRYKPELRDEFERLCAAWGKASSHVGYYGASTWMRVGIGAPLGPSLPLLKHTFATIRKSGFDSVYYYSLPWDSCGAHNYLAAKLMWNAGADVETLFADWLARAYGPGGEPMGRLYALLDAEIGAFKKDAPRIRADYEMTSEMALKVYLKNFWKIEELYKEAVAKAATEPQRVRLAVFGDNLAILHHVFLEAGVLDGAQKSVFYRTPEQYKAFLDAKKGSLAVRTMETAGNQGGITGIVPMRSKALGALRTLNIPRLPKGTPPPRLDGDLGDAAWRMAAGAEQYQAVADKFSLIGGEKAPKNATRALVTYDDDYLYISFRCADAEVLADEHGRDEAGLYNDDCVEVFFTTESGDPTWYWHLTVNAKNSRWDALTIGRNALNTGADLEWDSATAQGEGYWAAEIRIPFKAIKAPGAAQGLAGAPVGATWRVNLCREDKPTNENSAWSPVERGFLDNPAEFGKWYFPR